MRRNIFEKRRDNKVKHQSAGGVGDSQGQEEFSDPWLIKLSQEVNAACEIFWTKTPDRVKAQQRYLEENPFA